MSDLDAILKLASEYVRDIATDKLGRFGGEVLSQADFDLALEEGLDSSKSNFRYPWQAEFINASADNPERSLLAGNRTGKTDTESFEVATHMTGLYPDWWTGRRFTKPIEVWCGGVTNESSRDIQQKSLLGGLDENKKPLGTGWIPLKCLTDYVTFRQCGVSGVVDTIRVKHVSGGHSELTFKAYEQGREKWQGTSKDFIWLDEEPSFDIYTECLTRLIDRNGLLVLTATPLLGMSDVVRHFLEGGPGIFYATAGWDHAPHLSRDERERLAASYPKHERDARTKGIPMLGSGVVYPIPDDDIICDPFRIPDYGRCIAGIDFGISHPTAVVWMYHNTDTDVIYIYDCYQREDESVPYHADAIKDRGDWIPVSWPHDGLQRDKGTAQPLAEQYRSRGVNMLWESARWEDKQGGGQSKESAISKVLDRMYTGRFKVFSTCQSWFEQKRMYHRKDGIINPVYDDVLKAGDYALMMLRHAQPKRRVMMPATAVDYEPLGY